MLATNTLATTVTATATPVLTLTPSRAAKPRVNLATIQRHPQRLQEMHDIIDSLSSAPAAHGAFNLALAVASSMRVSQQTEGQPVWLLLVGAPGSGKTSAIRPLEHTPWTVSLDTLTENAFVSGYREENGQQAEDLLPQLNEMCLLLKDLTTLFGLRDDKVKKLLGEMQSMFDGEFIKATGSVGVKSYESRFALVGCITTQALASHHRHLSSIGNRFLYYRLPALTQEQEAAGFDLVWSGGMDLQKRQARLKALTAEHLQALAVTPVLESYETPDQRSMLSSLAQFITRGRAHDDESIDSPYRALKQLRDLGRSLARVQGRTQVSVDDLRLLGRVALSSIPIDRAAVLGCLAGRPEGVTLDDVKAGIGKEKTRAHDLCTDLVTVGLLEEEKLRTGKPGQPRTVYLPTAYWAPVADYILMHKEGETR